MLKTWNLALIIGTFLLVLFGTFLTRSGVLESVHAFTEGSIGMLFLSFIAVISIASLALIGWRSDRLHAPGQLDGLVSRESAFILNNLVFVAVPNPVQVGYQFRKHVVEPEFVKEIDEKWTDIGMIRRRLEGLGVEILAQGVLDVPPWPDTVMPASELLGRLGIRSKKLQGRFQGAGWQWSTMAYYQGVQPDLYDRVMKHAWLEHWRLSWRIKQIWAHHRWVLGRVSMAR